MNKKWDAAARLSLVLTMRLPNDLKVASKSDRRLRTTVYIADMTAENSIQEDLGSIPAVSAR